MSLCLGRLPAVHTLATMRAGIVLAKALAPLGKPPEASDDWVSAVDKATRGDWRMFANDVYGDCVVADSAHQIMLHTANAGSILIPSEKECVQTYLSLTGGRDTGLNETAFCQYLATTGLAGQKSAGAGMVDPANLDHIRWCVQLFGACRLGITVTDRMQALFGRASWADMDGREEGGHDVPVVKYDKDFIYVVTWAKLQPVAWSLMANPKFCQEAHAEVWPDFCRASGAAPNDLSLPQLLADLPLVA